MRGRHIQVLSPIDPKQGEPLSLPGLLCFLLGVVRGFGYKRIVQHLGCIAKHRECPPEP